MASCKRQAYQNETKKYLYTICVWLGRWMQNSLKTKHCSYVLGCHLSVYRIFCSSNQAGSQEHIYLITWMCVKVDLRYAVLRQITADSWTLVCAYFCELLNKWPRMTLSGALVVIWQLKYNLTCARLSLVIFSNRCMPLALQFSTCLDEATMKSRSATIPFDELHMTFYLHSFHANYFFTFVVSKI